MRTCIGYHDDIMVDLLWSLFSLYIGYIPGYMCALAMDLSHDLLS